MSARLELIWAGTAAVLAHGALLGLISPFGAAGGGGGSDGRASISFVAGSAELAALVETWEAAPEAAEAVSKLVAPSAEQATSAPNMWLDTPVSVTSPTLETVDMAAPAPRIASLGVPTMQGASAEANDVAPVLASPAPPTPISQPTNDAPVATADALPKVDPAPKPPDVALAKSVRPTARPEAPATVARDSGGTQTAGRAAKANARSTGTANKGSLEAAWATAIQRRIARFQTYPRGARGAGRVRLQMVILPNGQLSEVSVAQSSGVRAFDQAALKAARRAAPFPPAPEALRDDWYRVAQWVSFSK